MNRFISELRRREVFRTAGLYVGICWILIEASSVMLPTFDAPEWILRWIIIAAVVGFPVMLVLAWTFDITEKGIEVQEDVTETVVIPVRRRRMDFVVIGVLAVALFFSLYMNITEEMAPLEDPDPVSVLIADFNNQTGNALFDGLLEQALNIGIESAPHVTSFLRNDALAEATRLQPNTQRLDMAAASLVAVREGIKLVLAGTIQAAGSGFELEVDGIDPAEGRTVFTISGDARSPEAVLQTVGELSQDVREELGDTTLGQVNPIAETFTAASLEAAKAYTNALQLAYEGKHGEAVSQYRLATELDPNFGRAYSGWALSEFKLGRTEEATELWDKALSLMETMTERERLRTLGLYYASVTGNFENAVQSFSELVEKYPADAAGHNNLAVAYFLTLDFARASEEGRKIMEIYPRGELYRSNYALYSMYSGDFADAASVAQSLVDDSPGYGTAYLPIAIAALAAGDPEGARSAYKSMSEAEASEHTNSLAALGLADVAIFGGEFRNARSILAEGAEADMANENRRAAAVKLIALAETDEAAGNPADAIVEADRALGTSSADTIKVAAARLFADVGEIGRAAAIGDELAAKLQSQSRAYGMMIQGMVARDAGDFATAVDTLRNALELADLWLIRFELGRTYLAAEFYAEALSEFMTCNDRRGEAAAVFLDDMPSYRHMAALPYWTARAQQGLGMESAAVQGYEAFIALRPEGGPLADNARQRTR